MRKPQAINAITNDHYHDPRILGYGVTAPSAGRPAMAHAPTIDATNATSNAARTWGTETSRTRPFVPRSVLGASRMVHPVPTSIVRAQRETNPKWLRVRPPITETKQHARSYTQSATDEPLLNRVSQVRSCRRAPPSRGKSPRCNRARVVSSLVSSGCVRLRSSVSGSVRRCRSRA